MQKLEALLNAAVLGLGFELCRSCCSGCPGQRFPRSCRQDVGRAHRSKIADERRKIAIAHLDAIDIDYGHREPGVRKQLSESGGVHARMHVRRRYAHAFVRGPHSRAQRRKVISARESSDGKAIRLERKADGKESARKIVDRIQRPYGDA